MRRVSLQFRRLPRRPELHVLALPAEGTDNEVVLGAIASSVDRTRPSENDRERVAEVLRRACLERRLSTETFSERLDVVYGARTTAELETLLGDVPERRLVRRSVLGAVRFLSRWSREIGEAWTQPRLPRLVLPNTSHVLIGRSRSCDFVVSDPAVSARHAFIVREGGDWFLRDNGSLNGTFVNGWRVVDRTVIRPGDQLTFGDSRFVVATALRKSRTFSIPA